MTHANQPPQPPKPWIETPCIRSTPLSLAAGCNIYIKLEILQPSGSFKSRGIGNLLSRAIFTSPSPSKLHFYCSSGGNAGLACVVAATLLNRPATICVPLTTSSLIIQKLKSFGADVEQVGDGWFEADTYLRERLLKNDPNGVYVPPFDHADIWEGVSSMIDELEEQMRGRGGYDAVVCSVGGGGLFSGVMTGLERHGRLGPDAERSVKVLAMETRGADSLNLSVRNKQLSRLPAITSIATSLGATQVASKAYKWTQREEVRSLLVTDAEAAMACVRFVDDERVVVESACGASVTTAYNGLIREQLEASLPEGKKFEDKNVVIIVCGGSNITLDILNSYKEKYSNDPVYLSKFVNRPLPSRPSEKNTIPSKEEPEQVPFIMHDKEQHKEANTCEEVEGVKKPVIRVINKQEIEKQIEEFGKVVSV